ARGDHVDDHGARVGQPILIDVGVIDDDVGALGGGHGEPGAALERDGGVGGGQLRVDGHVRGDGVGDQALVDREHQGALVGHVAGVDPQVRAAGDGVELE